MEEKDEFKEGDEVEIVIDNKNNHSGKPVGYVFKIKELSLQMGELYLREFRNRSSGVLSNNCRLVKKKDVLSSLEIW